VHHPSSDAGHDQRRKLVIPKVTLQENDSVMGSFSFLDAGRIMDLLMKKFAIGCLIALVLFIIAGFAAWKILTPMIEKSFHSVLNQAQDAAFKEMGLAPFGTATGTAFLTDVAGGVFVTHNGKREAASQGPVAEGDLIETETESSAVVVWPDYGHTLLDASSKLTITKATQDANNINVELKLDSGRIWTRLERLLGTGSGFDVRSSNVVATVRGTSFGLDHRDGKNVNIQVAESHVAIKKFRTSTSTESIGEMELNPGEQALIDENFKSKMPKALIMDEAAMSDPFIELGNSKYDPALMSWISKALALYNSIPQGREMTAQEKQTLQEKALELWTSLPEDFQPQDIVDEATQ